MSKANKIEWSNIDGALPKSKRLHLEKDDVDSLYHCPIQLCEHKGFQSQRGCRKHVNSKHSWFFYFDQKPSVDLKIAANSSKVPTKSCTSSTVVDDVSSTRSKPGARSMPSFSSVSGCFARKPVRLTEIRPELQMIRPRNCSTAYCVYSQ